MKREIIKGALFYLFLTVLFFSPVIFGQKTFIPAEILDQAFLYPPREKKLYGVGRWDGIMQNYPNDVLFNKELKKGNFPIWNPYSFTGYPIFSNGQNAFLNPFKFLFNLVFSPSIARDLFLGVHFFLTGFFAFLLLLLTFKVGFYSALFGGIVWMFNFHNTVFLCKGFTFSVAPYLPLLLLSYYKYIERGGVFYIGVGSLSLSLIFFSQQLNWSLYACLTFALLGIWEILRSVFQPKHSLRAIQGFLCITIIGFFISAIQLLPTFELINRAVYQRGEYSLTSIGVKEGIEILSVIFFYPLIFGAPFLSVDRFLPIGGSDMLGGMFYQIQGYLGVITLFLVIYAFLTSRRGYCSFYKVLFVLALLLSIYTPFLTKVFNVLVPGFKKLPPHRALFMFVFAGSVLSAFGLEEIKSTQRKKFPAVFITIILSFTILLLAISVKKKEMPVDWFLPFRFHLFVPILYFFLSTIILLLTNESRLKFFVLFLVLIDLFPLALLTNMPVSRKLLELSGNYYEKIKKDAGLFRVSGIEPNSFMFLPVYSPDGYESLIPDDYMKVVNPFLTKEAEKKVIGRRRITSQYYTPSLLRLMSVKFVVQTSPQVALPEKSSLIYDENGVKIFQIKNPFPRAFIASNYTVLPYQEIRKRVREGVNKEDVLIEEDVNCSGGIGTAEIIKYATEEVVVKTNVKGGCGILVLTDLFYPGWLAEIDGKRSRIFRVYGFLRGIKLSEGEHVVVFRYQPLLKKVGTFFSLFGIGCVILTFVMGRKERTKIAPVPDNAIFSRSLYLLLIFGLVIWYPIFKKAIQRGSVRWHLSQASFLFSLGEEEKAEEYLRSALSSPSPLPEVYLKMGLLYSHRKRYARAIQFLQNASSYFPANPTLYSALSRSYKNMGDTEKAAEYGLRWLYLEPTKTSFMWTILLYLESKKYKDAFNLLRALKRYFYNDPEVNFLYALSLYAVGREKEGALILKGALESGLLTPQVAEKVRRFLKFLPPHVRKEIEKEIRK